MRDRHLLFCGPEEKLRRPRRDLATAGFSAPRELIEAAQELAQEEDISLSQFMRRALRRELAAAGALPAKRPLRKSSAVR